VRIQLNWDAPAEVEEVVDDFPYWKWILIGIAIGIAAAILLIGLLALIYWCSICC